MAQVQAEVSKETLAAHVRAALQHLKVEAAEVEAAVKQLLEGSWKHEVVVDVHVTVDAGRQQLGLTAATEFKVRPGTPNWEFRGHAPIASASRDNFLPQKLLGATVLHYSDLHGLVTGGKRFAIYNGTVVFADDKVQPKVLGLITTPYPVHGIPLAGPGEGAWHILNTQ